MVYLTFFVCFLLSPGLLPPCVGMETAPNKIQLFGQLLAEFVKAGNCINITRSSNISIASFHIHTGIYYRIIKFLTLDVDPNDFERIVTEKFTFEQNCVEQCCMHCYRSKSIGNDR